MEDYPTLQVLIMTFLSFTIATLLFYYNILCRPPTIKSTPPSPPSLPMIGHLHLLSDLPHRTFTQMAQKLGPIIYLKLGQVPTVIISSAQLAELILKTHDHIFACRPQLLAAQYLSFGCSDVTFSYGPYWRQARNICVTGLLSSKRVRSFHFIRDEEINRMLQVIATHSRQVLDVNQVFFTFAKDNLCRIAFGKRFINDELKKKKNEKDLVSVLTELQTLLAGFCAGDFFPEWEWVNYLSGMRRRLSKNLIDLREVYDEIIQEHVKNSGDDLGNKEQDFVDVLLEVQERNDLEVPITDDNLKAIVLDMFVAGTDTTSATLEWTMTELVRHPSVLEKAQNEVRRVVANHGGNNKVEESEVQHLHYMKAVIKESLRLHPAGPLLIPRESMEKCTIDGYEIPEKTRMLVNTYAIGRDPKSWKNPLEYNPERFLEENKDIDFRGSQDFRFLPFGGGRRSCPGYSLALATLELSLARLLYHFDWKLPPGVAPQDVDLSEDFGLVARKKVPLMLVPTINKLYMFKE